MRVTNSPISVRLLAVFRRRKDGERCGEESAVTDFFSSSSFGCPQIQYTRFTAVLTVEFHLTDAGEPDKPDLVWIAATNARRLHPSSTDGVGDMLVYQRPRTRTAPHSALLVSLNESGHGLANALPAET